MKLMENLIYSSIVFIFVYVIISLALRLFELTSVYNSHMIGGVVATLASMGLFMYFLINKSNKE